MSLRSLLCIVIFFMLVVVHVAAAATTFLYPVATMVCDGRSLLFLFHQKSLKNVELLLWDPQADTSQKILSSFFIPAGFTLLPSGIGFSFFDNGRLRIKHFHKRSPKALEFDEPLYNFGVPIWIDDQNFCLSAWKGRRCGIFHADLFGRVVPLVYSDQFDYLYPQKIHETLFYVERSKDGAHAVLSVPYPDLTGQVCPVVQKDATVVHAQQEPIMFLHMTSAQEGFFIQHPRFFDDEDGVIQFSYHQIKHKDGLWYSWKLFSFAVPVTLLVGDGDERLYESLAPLRPYHHEGTIYYADCACTDVSAKLVNLFCYSLKTKKVEQKTFGKSGQLCLAPIVVEGKKFYGGNSGEVKGFS